MNRVDDQFGRLVDAERIHDVGAMDRDGVGAQIQHSAHAARTGEIGDGRVFVIPVSHSYKIRTGEQDVL